MPRQSSFFQFSKRRHFAGVFFARPPASICRLRQALAPSRKGGLANAKKCKPWEKIERRWSERQIFLPLKKARLLTRNSAAGKRPQSKTRIFRRRKSFTSARKWFVFLRQCQAPGGVCIRRAVAQSGSASGLGPEGRGFESLPPDHLLLAFSSIAKIAKSARRARRKV